MIDFGGSSNSMQMLAHLIRHGHTDAVDERLCGRVDDIGLSSTGAAQADHVGVALAPTPIAAVYTSPLRRARETAQAIARHHRLTPQPLPALHEIDFGQWAGRSFAELNDDPRWLAFNRHRSGAAIPGGERLSDVQQRLLSTLRQLGHRHPHQHVALVSHAEVIRLAVLALTSRTLDDYLDVVVPPASVTTVTVDADGAFAIIDQLNR